jgi:hypothetical protein
MPHTYISAVFEGVDQIDLTGPFEVLSRIPNTTYRIYGKTTAPVRDLKGLRLTPDATLDDAPPLISRFPTSAQDLAVREVVGSIATAPAK